MKLAEFNDLCHREYADSQGVVTELSLSAAELSELTADALAEGVMTTDLPCGTAGARLTQIINPATGTVHPTPVLVSFLPGEFNFTGSAKVVRWAPIRS